MSCVMGYNAVCGSIFELSPSSNGTWVETTLYDFCSVNYCTDGRNPNAGLVFDSAGNLYGTTYYGGMTTTVGYCYDVGCGTVFKLAPNSGGAWTESVLYEFDDTTGAYPVSNLIFGVNGNLLGTASTGGYYEIPTESHGGVVFEIAP